MTHTATACRVSFRGPCNEMHAGSCMCNTMFAPPDGGVFSRPVESRLGNADSRLGRPLMCQRLEAQLSPSMLKNAASKTNSILRVTLSFWTQEDKTIFPVFHLTTWFTQLSVMCCTRLLIIYCKAEQAAYSTIHVSWLKLILKVQDGNRQGRTT